MHSHLFRNQNDRRIDSIHLFIESAFANAILATTATTVSGIALVRITVPIAAIKAAGYEPGKDVKIGMDCASSEFYIDGVYDYTKFEGAKGVKRTSDEQIAYLEKLISDYPFDSIADGMS